MRFKKLRLSVGIALILFIFMAGNIIVFGKLIDKNYILQLNDNSNQNVILVDLKQISPREIQNETKPIQPLGDVQNSPPPAPVIHHTTRTRAS